MGEPRAEPTSGPNLPPNLSSLFLAITEHAPLPMATVEGASHVVRYVNPAFCRLMRKSRGELVGRPFREIVPDKDRSEALLDRMYRTENPEGHTEQQLAKPHSIFWSYTLWPVIADERPAGIMVQLTETAHSHGETIAMNEALILGSLRQHELTEAADESNARLQAEIIERKRTEGALRESEERFASIFNQTTGGIGQVDLLGRFVLVNDRFCEIVGRSREELLELRMQDITHPEDVPDNTEKIRALAEGRAEAFVINKRYVRPDGSTVWVHDDVSVIRDREGNVRSIVAVVADITDRKRLEEDLAKRNEELAATDTAKNHFLAMLSHELRSPINIILLWSQILQRPGRSDDNLREGLEVIGRNCKAQARLVEDLLDVHRISSGKLRLDLADVDLAEIIRSVVESMAPAAKEKEVRIDLEIDPAPAVISGDPARLQQVLGNLLGNAVKFTPKGGEIRVTLRQSATRAELKVSDSGEGISVAGLPHIFDRFRQTDPLTSHTQGGLGLGLAIAKQLVELHAGTITAESPGKGRGATFVVSLPLLAGKRKTRRPPVSVKRAKEEKPPSLSGVLVLVVDDDPDTREAVRRVLEAADAETIVVGSADEALDALQRQQPDVLLSDIGMPGRDGYDLVRAVRALPPGRGGRVPAIAFTAYAALEERDRALSAGFQTHLAKPLVPARLIAAVAALVSRTPPGSSKGGRKSKKKSPRP